MRKRLIVLIIILIILFSLIGCSTKDEPDFFGTYEFDEISYLSGLSSTTIEYREEQMEGTKYFIKDKEFKIENANYSVDITCPDYVKEEIPTNYTVLTDVNSFLKEQIEYQYTIYEEDGSKTNWRLYVSSNNLWIASYVDNTVDGSEIIMEIIHVLKQ